MREEIRVAPNILLGNFSFTLTELRRRNDIKEVKLKIMKGKNIKFRSKVLFGSRHGKRALKPVNIP